MKFEIIANILEKMESTTKRLELTDYLVELFKVTPKEHIDKVIYLIQGKLRPDYEGLELGVADKLVIKAIALSSGLNQSIIEEFYKETGDLGYAAEKALEERKQMTLFREKLDLIHVYNILEKIALVTGEGSQDLKLKYIGNLLNNALPKESRYIVKIITSKLRLGIADYTILDALALAFTDSKDNRSILEYAYNISSDLGLIAKILANKGLEAVKELKVTLFKPIRPMLAERVSNAKEALERASGICAVEHKLDGERVQIHKRDDKIVLFSRSLENITLHYPDLIEAVKNVDIKEVILEGEIVAIEQNTGDYLPFQELMHRKRKYGVEEAIKDYPITLNIFDILYLDGKECLDLKYIERRKLLESIIKEYNTIRLVPMIIAKDEESIERCMEEAITAGCEGLMLKNLESNYRAGAREYSWMKLKREYRSELVDSLDLVIVGAFYGKGRRVGKYGALLLCVYDDEQNIFKTISKVGTGFTDEHLALFYDMLNPYKLSKRDRRVESKIEADVWFEPRIVIEVIASEITLSPLHTTAMDLIRKGSGLALRFPKFTGRIRDDKKAEDATTIREVIELYNKQRKIAKE